MLPHGRAAPSEPRWVLYRQTPFDTWRLTDLGANLPEEFERVVVGPVQPAGPDTVERMTWQIALAFQREECDHVGDECPDWEHYREMAGVAVAAVGPVGRPFPQPMGSSTVYNDPNCIWIRFERAEWEAFRGK